ncbi:unnamed protein product [Closterium sp. NIES-53]
MAKATSGWYPEVDVARQAQKTADECTTVQVGPIVCAHLRACALLSSTGQRWTAALLQRWHTVDLLYWQVAFLQCWRGSSTQRWQAVDYAVLSVDQTSCRVARKIKFVAAASGALLPVIGVGNAKVMGANGELVGLGNVLLVEEEKSSCIKYLWQLPIIPWNGQPPTTAAAAAMAKATAGAEETASTAGALDAVKKVQQPQQPHGEVLTGVDGTAAWAKASSGSGEADWETWHERLCHINISMLQKMVKDGSLKGLVVKGPAKEIGSCPTCLETKFTKFPFSSSTGPIKAPISLVHMDVVGPTRALSLSGSHYFLTIVDDHTRLVWVYPLKTKGGVAAAVLKEWMPRARRESGHKVKVIRTDNGGEFISANFEKELKRKGILHHLIEPYNPQQNNMAERFNQTV